MSRPRIRDAQGHTLRGADLHGADLQRADLRGVDLSGADLREADLGEVRTGLGTGAAIAKTVAAAAIAAAGGFTSSWVGQAIRHAVQSHDPVDQIGGVLLSAELAICLGAMVWRGTLFTAERVLAPTTSLLLLTSIGLVSLRGSVHGSGLLILTVLALFSVMVAAVALARAMASAVSRLSLIVVLVAWLLGARGASGNAAAVLVALATAVAGFRAAGGSEGSPRISAWARRLATLGGTSFRSADLRNAKLADAQLRCADLRGARLDGVDWSVAREIDFCRFDGVACAPPRKKIPRAWPRLNAIRGGGAGPPR